MNLLVLNGSPRGNKGNTQILLEEFTSGFSDTAGNSYELASLNATGKHEELARKFWQSDLVLIGYPLYVDSMPARVKLFIEKVGKLNPGADAKRPTVGFMVQSGFPEASHSRRVEKYHVKLGKRLNCFYAGTIIKGGCEGLRLMPPWATAGTRKRVRALGKEYSPQLCFDAEILKKLANPEKLGSVRIGMHQVAAALGLDNFYWNMNLKKNNSFEERFAAPYEGRWPGRINSL